MNTLFQENTDLFKYELTRYLCDIDAVHLIRLNKSINSHFKVNPFYLQKIFQVTSTTNLSQSMLRISKIMISTRDKLILTPFPFVQEITIYHPDENLLYGDSTCFELPSTTKCVKLILLDSESEQMPICNAVTLLHKIVFSKTAKISTLSIHWSLTNNVLLYIISHPDLKPNLFYNLHTFSLLLELKNVNFWNLIIKNMQNLTTFALIGMYEWVEDQEDQDEDEKSAVLINTILESCLTIQSIRIKGIELSDGETFKILSMFDSLTEFHYIDGGISDEAMIFIEQLINKNQLKHLNLSGKCNTFQCQTLAINNLFDTLPQLITLDLSSANIGCNYCDFLMKSLQSCPELKTLNLSGNYIKIEGSITILQHFLDKKYFLKLQKVDMRHNFYDKQCKLILDSLNLLRPSMSIEIITSFYVELNLSRRTCQQMLLLPRNK